MSHPIDRLVIGNALDDSSAPALEAGMAIAKHCGARATVVHAYGLPTLFLGQATGTAPLDPHLIEAERETKTAIVRGLVEAHQSDPDPAPRLVVEMGAPHRLISRVAAEEHADLIVLGANTRGPVTTVLGSTSDRVMRGADCPVMVVRGPFAVPPRRILAPVDLSPLSVDTLLRGLDLATSWTNGRPVDIHLLFVLSETERQRGHQFSPQQIDRLAQDELDRVASQVREHVGVTPSTTVRTGLPRHEILAALKEEPADLVVIGTHGHGGFERLVLGSVAVSVVHQAPCSVLVVPPPPAARVPQMIDDAITAMSGVAHPA